MFKMSRRQYADMFGPTTGDRVRLGDTSLLIEVEKDLTSKGDEAKFGGGKSLRDGMGQSVGVPDRTVPIQYSPMHLFSITQVYTRRI